MAATKTIEIEMTDCESSNIAKRGYDAPSQTLAVGFNSGATFHFYGVPKYVYDNWLVAASAGSFFYQYIKGNYEFARI